MIKQPTLNPFQTFQANYNEEKHGKNEALKKSNETFQLLQSVLEKADKSAAEKVLDHLSMSLDRHCDFKAIAKFLISNGLSESEELQLTLDVKKEAEHWLGKAESASKELLPKYEETVKLKRQALAKDVARSPFQTRYVKSASHTLYFRADNQSIAIWENRGNQPVVWLGHFKEITNEIAQLVGLRSAYINSQTM